MVPNPHLGTTKRMPLGNDLVSQLNKVSTNPDLEPMPFPGLRLSCQHQSEKLAYVLLITRMIFVDMIHFPCSVITKVFKVQNSLVWMQAKMASVFDEGALSLPIEIERENVYFGQHLVAKI